MNAETERTPEAETPEVQERELNESIAPEEEPVNQAQEMLENLEVAVVRMTICERQMQALQDSRYSSVAAELNSLIDDAERLTKKVEAIVERPPVRQHKTRRELE